MPEHQVRIESGDFDPLQSSENESENRPLIYSFGASRFCSRIGEHRKMSQDLTNHQGLYQVFLKTVSYNVVFLIYLSL